MRTDRWELEVHDAVPAREAAVVDQGLDEANRVAAPLHEVQALSAFMHGDGGRVIGGAIGRTWGQCCELQQLWVAASHRRHGVATRLLQAFEARAMERGCRFFYLETFSFQAPDFYRSAGYQSAVQLDGFSDGIAKHLMVKRVARQPPPGVGA